MNMMLFMAETHVKVCMEFWRPSRANDISYTNEHDTAKVRYHIKAFASHAYTGEVNNQYDQHAARHISRYCILFLVSSFAIILCWNRVLIHHRRVVHGKWSTGCVIASWR